ncbi:MAG: hypothetical protein HUJ54_02030 [Erysipelotrichaceae bacterium]|nr:hypothetical protein [Erysipelotrichaceae bacterium]
MNEQESRAVTRLIETFFDQKKELMQNRESSTAFPKILAAGGALLAGEDEIRSGMKGMEMQMTHLRTLNLSWKPVAEMGDWILISVLAESLFHSGSTGINRLMTQQATMLIQNDEGELKIEYVQDALIDPLNFEDTGKAKNRLLESMNALFGQSSPENKVARPLAFWDQSSVWSKNAPHADPDLLKDAYWDLEMDYLEILRREGSYKLLPQADQPVLSFAAADGDNYLADGFVCFIHPEDFNDEWGISKAGLGFVREAKAAAGLLKEGKPALLSPGKLAARNIILVPAGPVYGLFLDSKQEEFLYCLKQGLELAEEKGMKDLVICENWRSALYAPADFGAQKIVPFVQEEMKKLNLKSVLFEAQKADTKKALKTVLEEYR